MKLTPITDPTKLRLDTTVGTRIFAGDTMIHGDTGWRNISASIQSGWTGVLMIRRTGSTVMLRGHDLSPKNATGPTLADLPTGFRAVFRHPIPAYNLGSNVVYSQVINHIVQLDRSTGSNFDRDLTGIFPTSDSWPSSLPGLPV